MLRHILVTDKADPFILANVVMVAAALAPLIAVDWAAAFQSFIGPNFKLGASRAGANELSGIANADTGIRVRIVQAHRKPTEATRVRAHTAPMFAFGWGTRVNDWNVHTAHLGAPRPSRFDLLRCLIYGTTRLNFRLASLSQLGAVTKKRLRHAHLGRKGREKQTGWFLFSIEVTIHGAGVDPKLPGERCARPPFSFHPFTNQAAIHT